MGEGRALRDARGDRATELETLRRRVSRSWCSSVGDGIALDHRVGDGAHGRPAVRAAEREARRARWSSTWWRAPSCSARRTIGDGKLELAQSFIHRHIPAVKMNARRISAGTRRASSATTGSWGCEVSSGVFGGGGLGCSSSLRPRTAPPAPFPLRACSLVAPDEHPSPPPPNTPPNGRVQDISSWQRSGRLQFAVGSFDMSPSTSVAWVWGTTVP